jgi:major membrane immunogen (membrane-anchored lipoprotein)
MLINSRNSILMSLCLCSLLSACEVKKNLDDMHDATVKTRYKHEDKSFSDFDKRQNAYWTDIHDKLTAIKEQLNSN